MAPITVHIKHAGKLFDVPLDIAQPAVAFKESIYQVTGVPVDRMKVMVKGGMLKDDHDWKKVGPKEGQTFMVIGAAGELPKPPEKPVVFLEDMDDAELAEVLARPVGLINLGNTCYMNATLQAMRAIPELSTALSIYQPSSSNSLPPNPTGPTGSPLLVRQLRDLYTNMRSSADSFSPLSFLVALRQVVPQFDERTPAGPQAFGGGYAQQDAEECWVQVTNALNALPGLPMNSSALLGTGPDAAAALSQAQTQAAHSKRFVEQYMMGEMRRELKCDEAPEEEPTISFEKILKLECNITINTNFMHTGIMDALDQKIEKFSPSLGRQSVYTQKSRLSRLPANLTVHMVRFAWKADIGKKAKIMRKVKFPLELDVLDLVTDELKIKLQPINSKLKAIEKERAERRKVRKRTKVAQPSAGGSSVSAAQTSEDVNMQDASGASNATSDGATEANTSSLNTGELEDESVYRSREKQEVEELISDELKTDVGCSASGLYDLVAIVTHKGATADSGHYIGFVKKSALHSTKPLEKAGEKPPPGYLDEDDEDWYKFDDDKVSVFPKEKLGTLDGGGEDSVAYVLLYRSKSLE